MKKSFVSIILFSGLFVAMPTLLAKTKKTALADSKITKIEKVDKADQIQNLLDKGLFQTYTEDSLKFLTNNSQASVEIRLLNNLENLIFKKFVFLSEEMITSIQNTRATNKDLKNILNAWIQWQQNKIIKYKDLYRSSELYKLGVQQDISQLLKEKKYNEALKLTALLPNSALWMARIYFTQGDYINAIMTYNKIPRNSADYIKSKEELAWAYYHNNDLDSLFGLLPHLNLPIVPIENKLEARVISAVANLKICQFEDVKNEIKSFQKDILPLVKNLELQISKNKFETKGEPAAYAEKVYQQVQNLYSMQTNLSNKTRSEKALQALNRQQKKYWLTLRELIAEAILKMRFVKLELLGQLQKLERMQESNETLGLENLLASSDVHSAESLLKSKKNGLLIFPKGEDLWVDELFNQKSLSPNDCEKFQKIAEEKRPSGIKK